MGYIGEKEDLIKRVFEDPRPDQADAPRELPEPAAEPVPVPA